MLKWQRKSTVCATELWTQHSNLQFDTKQILVCCLWWKLSGQDKRKCWAKKGNLPHSFIRMVFVYCCQPVRWMLCVWVNVQGVQNTHSIWYNGRVSSGCCHCCCCYRCTRRRWIDKAHSSRSLHIILLAKMSCLWIVCTRLHTHTLAYSYERFNGVM